MSEKCRLCLKLIPIESVIKLYYFLPETIETAEMVRHIAKYLHIQVKKDDIVSTIICQDCNDHLEDFHKFSENISAKQMTLQNELLEVDLKTESPHFDDNTEEKMNSTCLIKDEVVENKISVADEAMLEYPIDVVKNELNSDKEDDDFGEQDMLTGDICENDASEEYEEYKLQDDIQSSNGIKTLLLTIADQNKAILEDNRCLKNSLTLICDQHKKIAEKQIKFEEEHKKNMDTIYKLQSYLAEEFIHLRTSVDTIMKSLRSLNSAYFLPEISTPDDILSFDAQIKDDDNIKSQLIKKFGSQPCDDIRKFVIQNLKLLFTDDIIASKFSWSITKNNISVKDFNYIKILKDVANEKIPQTTNSTIEGHIKAYFNSSKDRLNKKLKRQHDCI